MRLLHMYRCYTAWLETPAIQPEYVYVYWRSRKLEEHVNSKYVYKYQKVPIGTNPFN